MSERARVGVIIPAVTVFDEDGSLDLEATTTNLDWYVECGVDALLIAGSCGEFFALEEAERRELVEAAIEAVDGRVPVFVGVMHTSTKVAERLARHAESAGASAVMSVPPYYSSGPEREVVGYFRDIANSVEIPLIVYNNPAASGVGLSVQTLADLAEEGTAAIIKESHGDPGRIQDLRLACPDSTRIVYGEDYGAFQALMVGADGWVSGVGNVVPELAVRVYEAAVSDEVERARALWYELLPLVEMTSFKPMFGRPDERPDYVQIFKRGLELRGRAGGTPRRPLLALDAADTEYLGELLRTLDVAPEPA